MPDPTQMIQLANDHTARMFGVINQSMQQSQALQLQVSNGQANLAMKGLEFAEQIRMNDARVKEAEAVNSIRAKQLELDTLRTQKAMEHYDMQANTEKLRFENERIKTTMLQTQQQNALLNDALAPVNNEFVSSFLEIKNPEMAKEYFDWQGRVKESVYSGNKINLGQAQEEVRGIIAKYKDSPLTESGFSNEVAGYLDVLSPKDAAIYRKADPRVRTNRVMLANAMINADDKSFSSIIQANPDSFDENESRFISNARSTINAIESNNDRLYKELERNYGIINAHKNSNVDISGFTDRNKEINDSIKSNNEKLSLLKSNVSSLNFDFNIDEKDKQQIETPPEPPLSEKVGSSIDYAKNVGVSDDDVSAARDVSRHARLNNFFSEYNKDTKLKKDEFPKEFTGIDFSYTLGTSKNDIPDNRTLVNIVKTIEGNIDSSYDLSNKSKAKEFRTRFDERAIDNIIKNGNVNAVTVPISEFAAERIFGVSYGDSEKRGEFAGQGIQIGKSSMSQISSFKDMQKMLDGIDDKQEREVVEKELISAILTYGISSTIQD